MKKKYNGNRFTALLLAAGISASMMATPAFAADATPETATQTATETVDETAPEVAGDTAPAVEPAEDLAPADATATQEDAAGEIDVQAANTKIKDAVLNIGATQDSMNITWYGTSPTGGQLKYGTTQENAVTVDATVSPTSNEGWYKNTVQLTGLTGGTTYQYALCGDKDSTHFEGFKTFTTQSFGDGTAFSFLIFGDPQIGSSKSNENDTKGWLETVATATTKFPTVNFLFSMGDQVDAYYNYEGTNRAAVEEQYDDFLSAPELSGLALATEIGNHDAGNNTALYGEHFTLPNISATYGQISGDAYSSNPTNSESTADGDYSFTYNGALFMVLNSSCLSTAEHKAFIEETIAANPDATWRVVSFHKSIYSVASHVTESDIETLRNGLSPVFKAADIDIVLQGHDHVYARSYIMGGDGGMTADVKKNADGSPLTSITDADGVQYLTFNSASGSKFYNITQEAFEYTAVQNQEKTPNYALADVTKDSFTVTTYRSIDNSVVDTITLNKT
ncbi:MAG: metallophosphoesterase family protein, partial [Gemmiger sp.]|nr:metallophosphoesterase family protein [Gemmiger sp.]